MLLLPNIVYCCIALPGLMRSVVSALEDFMNRPIVFSTTGHGRIPALNADDVRPLAQANP